MAATFESMPTMSGAAPAPASPEPPASRFAALFGRGRRPHTEPEVQPLQVQPDPNPRLAAGWRVTAVDETVWPPNAPVYQPPAPETPAVGANGRPSLLGPRPAIHSQPVVSGIRPCYQCALPLSANARFCRRCGTPQQPGA